MTFAQRWLVHPLACSAAFVALGLLGGSPAVAETLLVVRKTDNAVDFMDPGSGLRLATVATGFAPHEISVSPDGKQAVVSNYGTRDQPGTTVSIIDLEQPRELRRIDLAPHSRPHGVAWYASNRVAVTTEGSRSLLVVDPVAGRVLEAIATGQETSHMVAVSPDGGRAYVTNLGSGSTTAIDLVANRKIVDVATGAGSEALALSPDGRALWVAARAEGRVAIMDTATLRVTDTVPLPGMPIRIVFAPDGQTALVSCAQSSDIVAVDVAGRMERGRRKIAVAPAPGATQRLFAQLAPGSALPVGVLLSGDGTSAYVAATMGDSVVQFDRKTLAVVRTIPVAGEPDGLGRTAILPQAVCHGCESSPGER